MPEKIKNREKSKKHFFNESLARHRRPHKNAPRGGSRDDGSSMLH